MPETIAYQQVRRIRIAPDGVHVILKDGSVRLFQAEELEFELPNGDIVDIDQLIEAINLKGYVSKRKKEESFADAYYKRQAEEGRP